MQKSKLIVILGQTATGKSGVAVRLAKKFNGEIVSADSRQIYRGLDLGTGKITKKEMRGIPHHLLDIASPREQFSVAEYKKLADTAISGILRRGKIPILCGGTGLYIDTVVNGTILPGVAPNIKLRKKLNNKTTKQLFEMLKKLDPRRAGSIDPQNPRRLIRAIEIARALGKVPIYDQRPTIYDTLKTGLILSDKTLKRKIHIRLFARISRGMITEAKRLRKRGLSRRRMEALGLEYRYLARYLNGKISKQEMLARLETEIWRYAKRQRTWFKRDKKILWFEPKEFEKIEKETKRFLKRKHAR
ncbi:MAG: tRNA (adenosine(37)-N6)-dimethylallyltransferase MiaA [Patescibacteria group bacterium]